MSERFDASKELGAGLSQIGTQRNKLARIVGPWFVLYCLLAAASLWVIWNGRTSTNSAAAQSVVLIYLLLTLGELLVGLCAAIQWCRLLAATGTATWYAVPPRVLWRWIWRWLFFAAMSRVTDQTEPWLKAHLSGAASWLIDGLSRLALLFVLVVASQFTLDLPALSIGAPVGVFEERARIRKAVGPSIFTGFALALVTWTAVLWALDGIAAAVPSVAVGFAAAFLARAFTFGVAILLTTYVTRIYLRSIDGLRPNLTSGGRV